jgi:TolB protein
MRGLLLFSLFLALPQQPTDSTHPLRDPQERHLKNVKQLTFKGENAECYWSFDGKKLIYQSSDSPDGADQIYSINPDGTGRQLVSTGMGKCTCGYYFPNGKRVLFSSTHWADPAAPPPPDYSKGYVWNMYKTYEIFTAKPDGTDLKQLTHFGNYTAESTINRKGVVAFTSAKDGDLDIYTMDLNGKRLKRLTNEPGYDGGPFWTPNGKQIVYRRSAFSSDAELQDYKKNLAQNLYRPGPLEIWIMNADGSHKRQITHLGCASFAPYMHSDGKHIVFSSNYPDAKGREFDVHMINVDGIGFERITYTKEFDGFPMFSPNGKKIVFCSNRAHLRPGETDVFIADWVP